MRLFVALLPGSEAAAHLDRGLRPLRREAPQLRWIPPERWHVTLAFLGEVADTRLPGLRRRLASSARRHAALRLELTGGGRFDGRVLWVGVEGGRERHHELRRLAESAAAAGRRAGIEVEERRFRPHLTVARSTEPLELRPLVARLREYGGPPWQADQLHLVRSRLGPRPTYETLASWPLGGRASLEQ